MAPLPVSVDHVEKYRQGILREVKIWSAKGEHTLKVEYRYLHFRHCLLERYTPLPPSLCAWKAKLWGQSGG